MREVGTDREGGFHVRNKSFRSRSERELAHGENRPRRERACTGQARSRSPPIGMRPHERFASSVAKMPRRTFARSVLAETLEGDPPCSLKAPPEAADRLFRGVRVRHGELDLRGFRRCLDETVFAALVSLPVRYVKRDFFTASGARA
jgi:hypothetical protein